MCSKTISSKTFKELIDEDKPQFVVWDLESGPLPLDELDKFVDESKVKYPEKPGPFDPSKIAYGNRTKIESKQAWVLECRKKHAIKATSYVNDCAVAREKHLLSLQDEAPLKAHLNEILAIGYGLLQPDGKIEFFLDFDTEYNLTRRLWYTIKRVIDSTGNFFTFNGDAFDIPIMTQKAWKHCIHIPYLLTKYGKMENVSIDAKKYFQMGNIQRATSLANVARFFGIAGKKEGMTGADFHKVLKAGQTEDAKEYLLKDIQTTYQVCKIMGLLDIPTKVVNQHVNKN